MLFGKKANVTKTLNVFRTKYFKTLGKEDCLFALKGPFSLLYTCSLNVLYHINFYLT